MNPPSLGSIIFIILKACVVLNEVGVRIQAIDLNSRGFLKLIALLSNQTI